MSEKIKFMDLGVGQKFKGDSGNGLVAEYIKTQPEQISCCVTLNAALVADPTQRVQFTPLVEIEPITESVGS